MSGTSDFSSKLKEARLKKGLSQNAVAEKLNISRQAISRWETGKGMPDINTLPMLSKLYDISIDELLGRESSISENKPQNITNDTVHSDTMTSNKSITKEAADINATSSHTNNIFNQEYALLILLLIISSFTTFVGFIVALYIFIWTFKNRRHYKLILILAVICFLNGLNNLYTFANMYLPFSDTLTIEKIS